MKVGLIGSNCTTDISDMRINRFNDIEILFSYSHISIISYMSEKKKKYSDITSEKLHAEMDNHIRKSIVDSGIDILIMDFFTDVRFPIGITEYGDFTTLCNWENRDINSMKYSSEISINNNFEELL